MPSPQRETSAHPPRRAAWRRASPVLTVAACVLWSVSLQAAGAPDRDRDGIPDVRDQCPDAREDFDGDQDADGCPDDRDSDGDGIADSKDMCPTIAEDLDGDKDTDGCPDLREDKDEDGVADRMDRCPYNPEDHDGFEDADGCPDPDNDRDQVADTLDLCPEEAEDIDEDRDDDGCPDLLTEVTEEKIELKDRIYFDLNATILQPRSYPILDEVYNILVTRPEMKLRIEGHTDDQGEDAYNLELSDGRARSVAGYLITRGVDSGRLIPVGFGEVQPLTGNDTPEGRAINRRVEFFVLDEPAGAP